VRLVGEGVGAARPRFTCSAAINMWSVNAAGVVFDNLYFPASSAAATARINLAVAPACMLRNLQFDCGTNDTTASLSITSAGTTILVGTTFTSVGVQPAVAMLSTQVNNDLYMDSVTFDGGSFGWSDYAYKTTAAWTRMVATRVSQLNGSHALMVTGTTGIWQQLAVTGDSRVDWTP
jgi:hypothetical protein